MFSKRNKILDILQEVCHQFMKNRYMLKVAATLLEISRLILILTLLSTVIQQMILKWTKNLSRTVQPTNKFSNPTLLLPHQSHNPPLQQNPLSSPCYQFHPMCPQT